MKRLIVVLLAALACRGNDGPVSRVRSVTVTVAPPQILVGSTAQAEALIADDKGMPLLDRKPVWTSLTPAVVTVSESGLVTGLQPGGGTVRASSGAVTGDAQVIVTGPVAATIQLSRDTATIFVPNGSVQLISTVRDATGAVIGNPTIAWQSSAPLIATVNAQGLVTAVAVGSATIRAAIDGLTVQARVTVLPTANASAPVIVAVNPAVLRPASAYTIVGNNFAPTAAGNAVVVDGVRATVTSATTTALSITLPASGFACEPTHQVFVQVTAAGIIGGGRAPLQAATPRTLAPGQSVVLSSAPDVRCNELSQTGGRYVLSLYNASRAAVQPGASGAVPVNLRGASSAAVAAATRVPGVEPAPRRPPWSAATPLIGSPAFAAGAALRRSRDMEVAHASILQHNIDVLRSGTPARASRTGPTDPSRMAVRSAQLATVGAITPLKIPNLDGGDFCVNSVTVGVRTVFVGEHSIIVEDTASSVNGRATLQGQMSATFTQLGLEFESVMWPILTGNFGNPLVLDGQLSATGKVVMLFSPRVNAMRQGLVTGFVVSCDLKPVAQAPSSNVGEYFYAIVPTNPAAGYQSPDTRDSWARIMRATVIHEVKHIVSFAERTARSLPLEDISWEEGMARNVEELYARKFYNTLARQNTGYAASLGCDIRFALASPPECANRPLLMLRHFDALYQYLGNPEPYSPLGRAFGSDATFYASAWSLERWANDHFAASESQFLKDFTTSPVTGVQNLEARTGRPWEEMLGEWSAALYLDDEPGFTSENVRLRLPSWNLPDLWLGMCSDLGPCTIPGNTVQFYPRANPFQPTRLSFGAFEVNSVPIAGGSFSIFDLSGTQAGTQLIELRSVGGAYPPAPIRLVIVRVR